MEKIGIIGAMETEIKLFLENMKNAGGNVKETAAGSLTFYEGKLKGKDVVVVSLNHRLNILGFFTCKKRCWKGKCGLVCTAPCPSVWG